MIVNRTDYVQHVLGWLGILCVGIMFACLSAWTEITPKYIFLGLSFIALMLWTFRLVHPLVPGIFLIVGFMGFSLNPPVVVLNGFATSLFFLGLATFIISGYLIESRIYYRFMEWSLRFFPLTPFWILFSVYFTGFFMTLTIPSHQNRLRVAQDICRQWASYMNIRLPSRQFNFFLISFHQSIFLFSPIFLTGSVQNLIVTSFLHPHDQERFGWLAWFSYSFLPLIVLWVGIILFLWIASYKDKVNIHRDSSLNHMALLGKMGMPEKISLFSVFFFIAGFLTSSFHQLPTALWAGIVLLFLLINRSFSFDAIQRRLEWTDLLLLGCLGSIAFIADKLNVLTILENLSFLTTFTSSHHVLFLVTLALAISLARLILPYRTVILLGSFCLIPFSYMTTIHAWVMGFVLLTSASSSWRIEGGMGLERFVNIFNVPENWDKRHLGYWLIYFNGLRIISIMAALAYWQDQGLL